MPPKEWTCGLCTFHNTRTKSKCEVCDAPRPTVSRSTRREGGGDTLPVEPVERKNRTRARQKNVDVRGGVELDGVVCQFESGEIPSAAEKHEHEREVGRERCVVVEQVEGQSGRTLEEREGKEGGCPREINGDVKMIDSEADRAVVGGVCAIAETDEKNMDLGRNAGSVDGDGEGVRDADRARECERDEGSRRDIVPPKVERVPVVDVGQVSG
ncbi:hypothetical protein HK104_003566 [Borealophlyctis nickersoniae]|nr:hypothetical protein HK104_003566 [Borealophlyctis nickersoniae]